MIKAGSICIRDRSISELKNSTVRRIVRSLQAACLMVCLVNSDSGRPAFADPRLDEAVVFTGQILFLEHKVPGLVIGAVRNGETSVQGFGERSDGGPAPDGDTLLRIGSITKAFTGQVLANMAAENKVSFTDTLAALAPGLASDADTGIQRIRLIDLVTHSAGLPRQELQGGREMALGVDLDGRPRRRRRGAGAGLSLE